MASIFPFTAGLNKTRHPSSHGTLNWITYTTSTLLPWLETRGQYPTLSRIPKADLRCQQLTTARAARSMVSAKPTRSGGPRTPTSFTTSITALDFLESVSYATVRKLQTLADVRAENTIILSDVADEVRDVGLLARGGYNTVWLVNPHRKISR
ncbi:hypothetical protein VUR80DRAFT_7960 [Thermomyces stellatus]